jgi:ribose transport system permease protein
MKNESINHRKVFSFVELLGACIIGVLANGLILYGLSDFMRQMITGVVIILAVIIDKYSERFSVA